MKKLGYEFYKRDDVVKIAKELLGKVLVTNWEGLPTSGRIVETEAYNGVADRASHAFNGKRTARTEIMFGDAGTGYIYFCYGIHHLFNVVTNVTNIPHAILIRAIEPMEGIEVMVLRTGKVRGDIKLTSGPGNLSKALGIHREYSGISLLTDRICITDDDFVLKKSQIVATPRIGVAYAGDDAKLPYRFFIRGNPYVSSRNKF